MSKFIHENFLLETPLAESLFHDIAKPLPIIDYHNHLPPNLIALNHQFENLTSIWLDGDHYKWRAMRTLGVQEKYITGEANPFQKFEKWAETVPMTIRNPLYHWTHMELASPFGISDLLNSNSAKAIYDQTQIQLQQPEFSTQGLLTLFNVELVGTTDDPIDTLTDHQLINKVVTFKTKVVPTFRPDKSFALAKGDDFRTYMSKLSDVANIKIKDFESLEQALYNRIDFFDANGCISSDHGLTQLPYHNNLSKQEINRILLQVLAGKDSVSEQEQDAYTYYLLSSLCQKYYEKKWVQQFHLGPLRNTNKHKLSLLGPDTGYDSIGDYRQAERLASFLNDLEVKEALTKTIIYNVNPSDNAVFASMIGNFQEEGVKGKIQFGSGWWFLDQLDGMKEQINILSNLGLISCFIGMLTDSRSFLSYSRHEYFRRLLCNIFANDVKKGYLPNDSTWIASIIKDICYYNAKAYFKNL